MPKFRVKDTFEIPSRGLFVLAGSIIEGKIQAGMFVHFPFNPSLGMTAKIQYIEFARRTGGGEDTCLCIESEPEMNEVFRSLEIGNETLEVTESGLE